MLRDATRCYEMLRDATEMLRRCYGDATEMLRDATEMLWRCCGDAMEMLRGDATGVLGGFWGGLGASGGTAVYEGRLLRNNEPPVRPPRARWVSGFVDGLVLSSCASAA